MNYEVILILKIAVETAGTGAGETVTVSVRKGGVTQESHNWTQGVDADGDVKTLPNVTLGTNEDWCILATTDDANIVTRRIRWWWELRPTGS